jgi:hypothetical protein
MNRLFRALLAVFLTVSAAPLTAQQESLAAAALREGRRLAAEPSGAASQGRAPAAGSIELRWSELPPLLQGNRVHVTLNDGTTVQGDVLAVRDDGLILDISRSSRRAAYRPGSGTLARTDVSVIRIERSSGGWGRHLGTLIGALSGVVIGGYVTGETTDSASAGIPLFLTVASAITVAGYYGGRRLDRKVTTIRVLP